MDTCASKPLLFHHALPIQAMSADKQKATNNDPKYGVSQWFQIVSTLFSSRSALNGVDNQGHTRQKK